MAAPSNSTEPSQQAKEARWIRQVPEKVIRLRGGQILERGKAASDRHHPSSDGACALDVERRVADDPQLPRRVSVSEFFVDGLARCPGNIVSTFVMISVAPQLEVRTEPKVCELEIGRTLEVPGQDPQHGVIAGTEVFEKFRYPSQYPPPMSSKCLR